MSIVNYRPAYLEQCYDIDIKSYLWPWSEESWSKPQGHVIRVRLMGDTVVGFFSFTVVGDTLMVSKLCVHPGYLGMGIGAELHTDLIRIGIQYQKKHLRMMLHEDNLSRDFLVKYHWKAISVDRGLFPDGCDGYLFTLEL